MQAFAGMRPKSLKTAAYQHIQSRIISGELGPGDVIAEVSLAKDIGISRTPVREAVAQLVAEGILEQAAGRGTVVKRPTRSDIIELFELREALEVYSVSKVASQSLADTDVERLERLCDDILELAGLLESAGQRRLSAEQMERFISTDLRFHLLLLRATGNQRIMKVIRDTRLLIRIFAMRREGHEAHQLRQIHASHKGILEAVRAGDCTRAAAWMGEHIRQSRQERLDEYDRWERISQIPVDDALFSAL